METENNYQKKYGVLIKCFTFNQSRYIEQALSSFVYQETTFPFIIALVDDCSTDGQVVIIKDFIEKEFVIEDEDEQLETEDTTVCYARNKQNSNCYIVASFLKYNHYSKQKPKLPYLSKWIDMSKYQAICEGDDYWIDYQKLQKQYCYLETHRNCSMCFSAYQSLFPDGRTLIKRNYPDSKDNCLIKDCIQLGGAFTKMNTILFRTECALPQPSWYRFAKVGDVPLFLTLFMHGDVGYINDVMACYRVNSQGSWSSRNKERSLKAIISDFKTSFLFWRAVNKETRFRFMRHVLYRQLLCIGRFLRDVFRLICKRVRS